MQLVSQLMNLMLAANSFRPVNARWTTERCAVCRWVEDWDYNKIIICNRYFLLIFEVFLTPLVYGFIICFRTACS